MIAIVSLRLFHLMHAGVSPAPAYAALGVARVRLELLPLEVVYSDAVRW